MLQAIASGGPVGKTLLVALVLVGLCSIHLPPLRADDSTSKRDEAFTAGSVWTGHISGDERKAGRQNREAAARLRVIERDGENFTADLAIRGPRVFAIELQGKVRDGRIAAKVTKIINGVWPDGTLDDTWSGQINGEQLVLAHTNKKNLTSTAKLTLDKDANSQRRPNQ
jgi:hypothetical protein